MMIIMMMMMMMIMIIIIIKISTSGSDYKCLQQIGQRVREKTKLGATGGA